MDLRSHGPWQRRIARPVEALPYSPLWATNAPAGAKAVVKVYPCLKEKPTYIAIDLSGGTTATRYPIEYLDEIPGGSWSDEYKTTKLVLRHIPAGSFIMGGRNTDYPGAVNTNLHMVTLTRDFYIGVFEFTQRQWELVMGDRPSTISNSLYYATRPVESVSFNDMRGAVQGAGWPLSKEVDDGCFFWRMRTKTGLSGFDLPTKAQWEYACRAGTQTALNNGENITEVYAACQALNKVARNAFNSGRSGKGSAQEAITAFSNSDLMYATANVGSYTANAFGLYDTHGNVYERGLDWLGGAIESRDPVGPLVGEKRVNFGGGWSSTRNSSFSYQDYGNNVPSSVNCADGFRVVLQGGDLPDLVHVTSISESSSAGAAEWMPEESGPYYLTHEVMNGATNVSLMSAWFEVAGPRLTFVPDGELVPGVGIAIANVTDGWTVYYTTDGTEPTTSSTAYAGAIALNETTTVRAVAYNARGVRSEEASATFTLHDALGIASAVATPRYPWNGKVDVDVELKGDPESQYLVELVAKDLAGGTNLPVRTVYRDASLIPNPCTLIPAKHRLVWDAAADIAGDIDFNRVAVTVKATGSHLLAYPKTLELTVAGYTGTEVLTNVPTLVRLSTAIPGFSYSGFATTNGADLAFFTPEGRPLPYEIDEWNTNGESLVWVKLPVFANGTRFTAAWGNSELSTLNSQLAPHEVWRDYAGVWHMNEPSGTAFDSTGHHLDGIPSCGTNKLANVSQMVAYEKGACGRARVNAVSVLRGGTYMYIPAYDGLGLGTCFSFSAWLKAPTVAAGQYPRLASRKNKWTDENGWEFQLQPGSQRVCAHASSNDEVYADVADFSDRWCMLSVAYEGESVRIYADGLLVGSGTAAPVRENGLPLLLGVNQTSGSRLEECMPLAGQYDEVRLRGGSLSADRIKADYDMIANREFLSYGAVVSPAAGVGL